MCLSTFQLSCTACGATLRACFFPLNMWNTENRFMYTVYIHSLMASWAISWTIHFFIYFANAFVMDDFESCGFGSMVCT